MTIFKGKIQGVHRFAASQNRLQKFTHTPKHPRNTPFKPFMAIHITVVILVLDRDVFNSTLATLCSTVIIQVTQPMGGPCCILSKVNVLARRRRS